MGKYLRILRLQDQYIQFSSAIFGGIFVHDYHWMILIWAIAVTFLSFSAFIVNEVTDRKDTDRYSWNATHRFYAEPLDMRIVWIMFWIFSFLGIGISMVIGFFWWGLAIWVIGLLYSFKPVRLKGRFVFDILAQLFVWWGLPFLASVWWRVDPIMLSLFTIITSMIVWSAFYPYQIADYKADKKAGLLNTHVRLGVKGSTWFGFILGIIGIVLFFVFHVWVLIGWVFPIFIFTPVTIVLYGKWLTMNNDNKILLGMQSYSALAKSIGNIFPLYLFLVWRLV
jgi:4-hydroxybenzoate polyprenyltransferase